MGTEKSRPEGPGPRDTGHADSENPQPRVHAARTFAGNPDFTAVAVIALALGIGADTAMFTIADGAFGMTRLLRAMLAGVSPGDPATFLISTAVLASAGVAGCAVPARRAVRVDPITVLRCE